MDASEHVKAKPIYPVLEDAANLYVFKMQTCTLIMRGTKVQVLMYSPLWFERLPTTVQNVPD